MIGPDGLGAMNPGVAAGVAPLDLLLDELDEELDGGGGGASIWKAAEAAWAPGGVTATVEPPAARAVGMAASHCLSPHRVTWALSPPMSAVPCWVPKVVPST